MLSKNREILYNKACKSYQDFSQEEKTKIDNLVAIDLKIFQKMKNKI